MKGMHVQNKKKVKKVRAGNMNCSLFIDIIIICNYVYVCVQTGLYAYHGCKGDHEGQDPKGVWSV